MKQKKPPQQPSGSYESFFYSFIWQEADPELLSLFNTHFQIQNPYPESVPAAL